MLLTIMNISFFVFSSNMCWLNFLPSPFIFDGVKIILMFSPLHSSPYKVDRMEDYWPKMTFYTMTFKDTSDLTQRVTSLLIWSSWNFLKPLKAYQTGNVFDCLMINTDGNIQSCSSANILCEKTLQKDTRLCLSQSSLSTSVALNSTTTISLMSYATLGTCMEYCRATLFNQVPS